MLLILGACMINSASALYLKVDFAYPVMVPGDPCFVERFDLTAKDGWFPWAHVSFADCWRHDWSWCATYPDWDPPAGGVDGTGVDFQLWSGTTSEGKINDGGKRFAAYGMQQVTDGGYATGHPLAEPIANSGVSTFDSPAKRSLVLVIQGLGPGTYYLETYHNCGWDVDDPNYNNPDSALGYYNVADVNMAKIWVRGPDVNQVVTPEDFPIQRERVDANLVLVTTVFIKTDVCDCNVAFMPGSGGKVMVNAFILSTGKWYAREAEPENGAINVCPGSSLCWTVDESVDFHDVYLGTDFNDVNDATTATAGIYKERLPQAETCYTPAGLELGTTYYWRIDGITDANFWKGDMWTFTTNDGNAFDPYPADDVTKVPLDVNDFSWGAGCSAATHDVFFGTNADDVNNATVGSHPNVTYTAGATSGSYDPPGPLEYATHYYWRVDAVSSGGGQRWQGPTWHFKTKSEVDDPSLLVRYQFDELPPSSIALDSSGNEFDGSIGGDPNDWDPTGGRFGGCRIFGGSCTLPTAVPKTITSAITITMWLKDLPTSYNDDWTNPILNAISGTIRYNGMYIRVPSNQDYSGDWPGYILWRAGMEPDDRLSWDLGGLKIDKLDGWHHWVFIKDEPNQTMKIYFDGALAASASGTTIANLAGMYPSNIIVGSGSGTMDDFRIYNRALSDSDVLEVFRGGDLSSAWFPQPRDFTRDVARDVTLIWKPGDYADWHDVYFGTSWEDVNDATTASGAVYKGRFGPNTYNISDLDLDRTYYWRIDEVNDSDPCIWKGPVWRFTVANFIIIDDFESYNDSDNPIYDTWTDGGTSAFLDDFYPGDPTHSGEQSMWLWYFNNDDMGPGFYSEVGRDLSGMDFTQAGVKALTLFFYGDPTNDAGSTEEPYVGIDDGSTYAESRYLATGNPISDIQEEEWHEWNIAISDLNSVTLTAVENIYIGFGRRGSSTVGGTGNVYVDDVRLYPPKCVPEEGLHPEWDWSGNCIVDLADIGIMGEYWLRADALLSTSVPTVGPVGWWKLDDGSGTTATDTANNNDGTLEGSTTWVAGHIGTAVDFGSNDARIRVPHSAELMLSAVSVTAWIYPTSVPGYSARVVAKGVDLNNWEVYYMQFNGAASWTIRDPNHENHALDGSDLNLNEWIHLAGTYDGNAVKLYVNGQLDAEDTSGDLGLLQDTNDLCIGNRSDGNDRAFIGTIDDVRVYDYALSAAEVAYLVTGTTPTGYVPLDSQVNIYDEEAQGQKAVNFRDFAKFMTAWLNQQLWPPE